MKKIYTLIVHAIGWVDATKFDDFPSGVAQPEYGVCIGFILHKTKEKVTIVREIFDDGGMRDVVCIPAGMIRKITRVGKVVVTKKIYEHFRYAQLGN